MTMLSFDNVVCEYVFCPLSLVSCEDLTKLYRIPTKGSILRVALGKQYIYSVCVANSSALCLAHKQILVTRRQSSRVSREL